MWDEAKPCFCGVYVLLRKRATRHHDEADRILFSQLLSSAEAQWLMFPRPVPPQVLIAKDLNDE